MSSRPVTLYQIILKENLNSVSFNLWLSKDVHLEGKDFLSQNSKMGYFEHQ